VAGKGGRGERRERLYEREPSKSAVVWSFAWPMRNLDTRTAACGCPSPSRPSPRCPLAHVRVLVNNAISYELSPTQTTWTYSQSLPPP
jgi:hypothetical protein